MLHDDNYGSLDHIYTHADENNVSKHVAAAQLESPHISKPALWPIPKDLAEVRRMENGDLCDSARGDLLTELSKQIEGYLQFPRSTIFLHGLGCIASAMTKGFSFEYGFSKLPVGLYIITAQPPSTGKSEVNRRFFTPIEKAYKSLNELHERERQQLKREIKRLEKQLENHKIDKDVEDETIDKIEQKTIRLNQIPKVKPAATNTTIEAIDSDLKNNAGMFNIVSAESEAINVVVGTVYGDSSNKSNFELLLKAWDGEWYSSDRVSRDGYIGEVRASIAVIAQDDTIDTMLAAGASGRGLTERFLLLSERSMLGMRDHNKVFSFDKALYAQYEQLIVNIVSENDITLNFSQAANDAIKNFKIMLEPTMSDDGVNSHNLATGFIGKADKQVRKIASILHVIDQWQDGADRNRTVSDDYAFWAISIFEQLSKTFLNSADFMGYVGGNSEVSKLMEIISSIAEKGKLKMQVNALRNRIKNTRPFTGSRNLTKRLKETLIPALEELNYCILEGQTIYINPRLR